MRKMLKTLGMLLLLLVCVLVPNQTAKAVDIGLPPADYNASGKYPAGKVANYYYYSNVTNSQRKLVVYTPPGYTTSKKYPVVYSIHGIDNTPESIFRSWGAYANLVADNLIGSGQIEPCIIVAWDNNNINTHNELMYNVLPYVEKTFSVIKDADHRAIYGYSMGGGYAFAEVMGNLDTFHHLSPTSALPINHPSDDQMFKKGSKEVTSKLKTLVLSCGTKDWCGFYPANLATHNYCVQYNIPHYWLSVQGGNHDSGVWGPAMYYLLKYAFPKNGSSTPAPQPSQPTQPQPSQPVVSGNTVKINDGWYYIKGVDSQKYLTVNGSSAGSNVEIRAGIGSNNQKWKVTNTSDGYITLTSAVGDFMLDVANGASTDGANIGIYHGYSGDAQKFVAKSVNQNNVVTIVTKASNGTKVLDVEGKRTTDGTNVCQYKSNGQSNQQWIFEAVNNSQPTQPQPTQPQPTQPQPTESEQPVSGKLGVEYSINSWGSGYQVNFKVVNKSGAKVNTWTVKVPKSELKIEASWNVEIKESGNYYVITPVSWNSVIENGNSVEFGVQGNGSIGSTLTATVQ